MVTLIKRYMETKISAIVFILGTTSFVLITNFTEILFGLANFQNMVSNYTSTSVYRILFEILTLETINFNYNSFIAIIFDALGFFTAGMFLLFIDYFENESISSTKLVLYIGSGIGYIIAACFAIGIDEIKIDPQFRAFVALAEFYFSLIVFFFLVYVILSCFRSIENVKHFAYDSTQLKQLFFMQLVIIFYYVVPLICIVTTRILSNILVLPDDVYLLIYVIISRMGVVLGNLILWRVYALTPRVAFLQPQRTHKLYVIADTGLLICSFNFRGREEEDTPLLAGGLSAMKSLLKEAVGASSDIYTIKFRELELMVRSYNEFDVLLITERASYFLHKAIEVFADTFRKSYDLSDTSIINRAQFSNADILVKKAFGLE
ncbi:MAG: hypothetical protein ACFFC7_20025 [Candidatus Hermodarchaeota archaeon]